MRKYKIIGEVTIGLFTCVIADSPEEASCEARRRSICVDPDRFTPDTTWARESYCISEVDNLQIVTSEEVEKSLGQIAYEADSRGGQQNFGPWEKATPLVREVLENVAQAVADEVRRREKK